MFATQLLRFAVAFAFLAPRQSEAQVPADLKQAMSARDLAVAKVDAATWDRLTTENFTVVTANGTLLTKAQRLAEFKSDTAVTPVPHQEETITPFGNAFARRFRAGEVWVLDIWVKDPKGWRVALVQVTTAKK
jgi:hypothetical protein